MTDKANIISPPFDPTSAPANDFNVALFTVDVTHKAHALPRAWSGQFVTLYSPVDCHYGFALSPSAEVDRAVAATDAGATVKVGGLLLAGVKDQVLLPEWDPARQTMYFVREAASLSSIRMWRSST